MVCWLLSKFILRPNHRMHRQPQNHLNNFVYYFISSFQWYLRLIKNKIYTEMCARVPSNDKSRPLFEVLRERRVRVCRSHGDIHTLRSAKRKSNDWVSSLSVTRTEKEKLTTARMRRADVWRTCHPIDKHVHKLQQGYHCHCHWSKLMGWRRYTKRAARAHIRNEYFSIW